MAINKITGIPIAEGINEVIDIPHTLSFAIIYRNKIDSLRELPSEKQPPRNLWDKPFKLREYLDHVWDDNSNNRGKDYIEINPEEVE